MFGENKCRDEKGNVGCGYHSEPMAPACLFTLTSLLAASNVPTLLNGLSVLSFVCFSSIRLLIYGRISCGFQEDVCKVD